MTVFDKIAENKTFTYGFLLLLSCFFMIGLGNVHLFDWDEINFAESAREMMNSGNYLRVQINYIPFWEKPPFFFWLQVLSMKLFGVNEFAARFPNAVFGFLYLFTFYLIGKRHYSAKFGLIWSVLFFGSLLPHLYFKSGIIDPVFNFFIFLSVYFMIRVIAKNGESIGKLAILSGVFSGLSVITKGPVGFLLLGLTFAVYMIVKRFKVFPPIKHILLFLVGMILIMGAWLSVEVYQNGFEVLIKFIRYQIELFSQPVAGHEQPFYYHFVIVGLGCFPLSIFAISSFSRKTGEQPVDIKTWMLCLFWVVMILFSITTTKIAHYSSMSYAPLSFLAALGVYQIIQGKRNHKQWVYWTFLIFGIILSTILIALPLIFVNQEWLASKLNDPFAVASLKAGDTWYGWEALVGVLFFILTVVAFILLRKKQLEKGILLIAGNVGITLLLLLFLVIPKVESISQGPAIRFFESLDPNECYVETYGHKSYAQYFYGRLNANEREESKDVIWMLDGEIDKPVWIVSKITHDGVAQNSNFKLMRTEGGFAFYYREVPE